MNKFTLTTCIVIVACALSLTLGQAAAKDETLPVEPTRTEPTVRPTDGLTAVAITLVPTRLATTTPTTEPTAVPTPLPEPTAEPTATPDYGGDPYEPDSFDAPLMYTGRIRRSFNPVDDVDYIALRVKPGRTIFKTDKLTGAADTYMMLYDKQSGVALVSNDDADNSLASQIIFDADRTLEILVEISNLSMGYGRDVAYDFYIISETEFTPTPSPQPTHTPTSQPTQLATHTPYPTYTPFPTTTPTSQPTATATVIWPTATKRPVWPTQTPHVITMVATATAQVWPTNTPQLPTATPNWQATKVIQQATWEAASQATQAAAVTQSQPIIYATQRPAATATPQIFSTLRIELFTDMDSDSLLDAGEGMEQVLVTVSNFNNSFQQSGYTTNGLLLIPITINADTLQVSVPYLGETQHVKPETAANSVQFAVTAPLLPIEFP